MANRKWSLRLRQSIIRQLVIGQGSGFDSRTTLRTVHHVAPLSKSGPSAVDITAPTWIAILGHRLDNVDPIKGKLVLRMHLELLHNAVVSSFWLVRKGLQRWRRR